MSETGRYLFAVTRGLSDDALEDVPGLRGAPVECVEHRGLQAVLCTVDLDEFGEEALRRNLEDLAWLEEVARAHNDVVNQISRSAAVAPMRLVTIYSGDQSVRARIEELEKALTEALDRVDGRQEWSVKVFAPRSTPEPSEDDASLVGGGQRPGAAYLQRKRDQASRRRASSDKATQTAAEVDEALAQGAVASRRLPPQDPRLTGRTDPMVLNAAYLVDITDSSGFQALVERLRGLHTDVTVELAGPWPAYSFATLD